MWRADRWTRRVDVVLVFVVVRVDGHDLIVHDAVLCVRTFGHSAVA
jgi:hypothetical protein